MIDQAGGHVSIPAAAFDPDGEVDEADVFCAACRVHESTDDNDIVLCDGDCRRAYHLKCLTPPLRLEDRTRPPPCANQSNGGTRLHCGLIGL